MNLYITGGHLTPALAVIDELKKTNSSTQVFFIGREHSQAGVQHSREKQEMELRSVPFFAINAAKFHRAQLSQNLFEIIKLPISFYQTWKILHANKPDVILSFGGYVALPVCILGKLFRARIVTHEQTKAAGLANQLIAKIADVIAVANEESANYFPKEKVVLTGNPIRQSLFKSYKTIPTWLRSVPVGKPMIYVTGGSQGSQIINQTIAAILPKLVKKYVVVHQCGGSEHQQSYLDLMKVWEKLPKEHQDSYIVREWVEEREVSFLFRYCRFVISRAGANTVEELILSGTPAIFIPLAFAYNDEQYKNMYPLYEAGAALYLQQKDLLPETLMEKIKEVDRKYEKIKQAAINYSEKTEKHGTRKLIELLDI